MGARCYSSLFSAAIRSERRLLCVPDGCRIRYLRACVSRAFGGLFSIIAAIVAGAKHVAASTCMVY